MARGARSPLKRSATHGEDEDGRPGNGREGSAVAATHGATWPAMALMVWVSPDACEMSLAAKGASHWPTSMCSVNLRMVRTPSPMTSVLVDEGSVDPHRSPVFGAQ